MTETHPTIEAVRILREVDATVQGATDAEKAKVYRLMLLRAVGVICELTHGDYLRQDLGLLK